MELSTIIEKYNGIIVDTCCLFNIQKNNIKIEDFLNFCKTQGLKVFFPKEYSYKEYRDRNRLDFLYENKLIFDAPDEFRNQRLYNCRGQICRYPIDDGELFCISYAHSNNLIAATDDKLPSLIYLSMILNDDYNKSLITVDDFTRYLIDPRSTFEIQNGIPIINTMQLIELYKYKKIKYTNKKIKMQKINDWLKNNANGEFQKSFIVKNEKNENITHITIGQIFSGKFIFKLQNGNEYNFGLSIKSNTNNKHSIFNLGKYNPNYGNPTFYYSTYGFNLLLKLYKESPGFFNFLKENNKRFKPINQENVPENYMPDFEKAKNFSEKTRQFVRDFNLLKKIPCSALEIS